MYICISLFSLLSYITSESFGKNSNVSESAVVIYINVLIYYIGIKYNWYKN